MTATAQAWSRASAASTSALRDLEAVQAGRRLEERRERACLLTGGRTVECAFEIGGERALDIAHSFDREDGPQRLAARNMSIWQAATLRFVSARPP